jgi:hypothetical protein
MGAMMGREGGLRFRKHWTREEMEQALRKAGFQVEKYFEVTDPFGKQFMNFVVRKP